MNSFILEITYSDDMGIKAFFTKKWPTQLGFYMAKWCPHSLGYGIAALLARLIVFSKPDVYWTSMQNFKYVCKEKTEKELDQLIYRQFLIAIQGYYDLFHNIGRGRTHLTQFYPKVEIAPEILLDIQNAINTGRGLLLLGCHMANFDLGGIGLSQYLPIPLQVLSLANPPSGFDFVNQLREVGHGTVTPINAQTLRAAMKRLKNGGIVFTGVDRPLASGNQPVTFFGETAYLPTGYIRIPLLTDCLVMTTSFYYKDHRYVIVGNKPMEMVRTGDKQLDIKVNVQRVLSQVETYIKQDPSQWMMFLPVWSAKNTADTV